MLQQRKLQIFEKRGGIGQSEVLAALLHVCKVGNLIVNCRACWLSRWATVTLVDTNKAAFQEQDTIPITIWT